jgi:serine/threonine-protein kinase HipA
MKALNVYMNRDRVGTLDQDDSGILRFRYAAEWLERADACPLSRMLPLSPNPFDEKRTRPFFSGILPEEDPRTRVAELLGISAGNDFGLLERLGGECAGAVSLLPDGQEPADMEDRVRHLNDKELSAIIHGLHQHPLLADDQDVRLSLAGAQDKLPVVFDGNMIAIPLGNTPSTHIIKPEPERFPGLVANEFFCMTLARQVGLNTAEVTRRTIHGKPCIIVTRYDRFTYDDERGTERLHQEDFCQALGRPPERKYQQEGGPTTRECIQLLREWSTTPVLDILAFLDALIFNCLIGNADAHGKNYSMLYRRVERRLAPLYDLISTVVWPGLSARPAMHIGNQTTINDLQSAHFRRLASESNLGWPGVRDRLHKLSQQVLTTTEELANMPGSDDMTHQVSEVIAQRCRRLMGRM